MRQGRVTVGFKAIGGALAAVALVFVVYLVAGGAITRIAKAVARYLRTRRR